MTVVFDAEPLIAFAFDEPGAGTVEDWLDRVYDGDRAGYVSTINLAEFRYVAARKTSPEQADAHIARLREVGVQTYDINDIYKTVSELKLAHAVSIGDAYAVGTAAALDDGSDRVTLLVGADDDYSMFEADADFQHLIERFRIKSV